MIFGSQRDFNLLVGINRELLSDVVEQEVLYYKISLDQTQTNIYGEAQEKVYWSAVKFNCLIDRGDQQTTVDDFGPDSIRPVSFKFLRQDLKDANTFPEVGDVILDNILSRVLFPAPFFPIIPTASPCCISKFISLKLYTISLSPFTARSFA